MKDQLKEIKDFLRKYPEPDAAPRKAMNEFIIANQNEDISRLVLSTSGKSFSFPLSLAFIQIDARRKTARKLPAFLRKKEFLFPSIQASEQSSAQAVALYHRFRLLQLRNIGKMPDDKRLIKALDMTAGLGIDSFVLAIAGINMEVCELDPLRSLILTCNSRTLKKNNKNITYNVFQGDSLDYLAGKIAGTETESTLSGQHFPYDLIFIDPARRDNTDRRTYFLEDSLPDITACESMLLKGAPLVMVKASPILDISRTVHTLKGLAAIDIVMVDSEVKELLLLMSNDRGMISRLRGNSDSIPVRIVDLTSDNGTLQHISCADYQPLIRDITEGYLSDAQTDERIPIACEDDIFPGAILYDPNSGIHKLNDPTFIIRLFPGLKRLSSNTDLYVGHADSNDITKCRKIESVTKAYDKTISFPGRRLRVIDTLSSRKLKKMKGERASVCVRNYPETAQRIRERAGLKEGDRLFIYGCRIGRSEKPALILTERID